MDILSTREIAVFIWIGVLICIFMLNKKIRKSFFSTVKAVLARKILVAALCLIGYVALITVALYKIGFWNIALTKDTLFWVFGFCFVVFFKLNSIKDIYYFKDILFDSLKGVVIIEFLLNMYTFSLWIELLLFPSLLFIVLIKSFSERDIKNHLVTNFFNILLITLAIVVFLFVLYKTIAQFGTTFSIETLKSFINPILLTILFIPFIYLMKIYTLYEIIFVRVDRFTSEERVKRKLKFEILKQANFNITKISIISKGLYSVDFSTMDIGDFVKRVLNK